MNVRPLTGQILVEVLPADTRTDGGLHIPDIAQGNPRGQKAKVFKGYVRAIGPWRRTKNGFGILPPFGVGHTVICSPYAGVKLAREIGEKLLLVNSDEILAVIEPIPTTAIINGPNPSHTDCTKQHQSPPY